MAAADEHASGGEALGPPPEGLKQRSGLPLAIEGPLGRLVSWRSSVIL